MVSVTAMSAVTFVAAVGAVSMVAVGFTGSFDRMASVTVCLIAASGIFGLGGVVVRMVHRAEVSNGSQ